MRAIAAEEAYNSEVSEPVFGRGTCETPKPTGKVGENCESAQSVYVKVKSK